MYPWIVLALGLGGLARADDAPPPPDAGAAPPGDAAVPVDPDTPPRPEGGPSGPPVVEDGGWTALPAAPGDFGSALDPLTAARDRPAPPAASPTAGPSAAPPGAPPAQTRARWGVRPRVAAAGIVGGDQGVLLGASATHQWWRLSGAGVRPSGATRLDLGGRIGGARGVDARLVSVHGLWFGPIGLLAGGAARWDRLETDAGGLAPGFSAGPQGRIVARAGRLVPWAAFTWSPLVGGPRAALPAGPPPDEQTWDFGLELDTHPLGLRLSGAVRETPTVRTWEAGLGLHVQL